MSARDLREVVMTSSLLTVEGCAGLSRAEKLLAPSSVPWGGPAALTSNSEKGRDDAEVVFEHLRLVVVEEFRERHPACLGGVIAAFDGWQFAARELKEEAVRDRAAARCGTFTASDHDRASVGAEYGVDEVRFGATQSRRRSTGRGNRPQMPAIAIIECDEGE